MAEIAYTTQDEGSSLVVTWADVTEADTFKTIHIGQRNYKSAIVQIEGTFGGATVVLQGSLNNTNFHDLSSGTGGGGSGGAISVTSGALRGIALQPQYIKPSASGGTSQSVTVTLFIRR